MASGIQDRCIVEVYPAYGYNLPCVGLWLCRDVAFGVLVLLFIRYETLCVLSGCRWRLELRVGGNVWTLVEGMER